MKLNIYIKTKSPMKSEPAYKLLCYLFRNKEYTWHWGLYIHIYQLICFSEQITASSTPTKPPPREQTGPQIHIRTQGNSKTKK